ncbi:hypothetical protein CNMCM5623_006702 [Aspergillus felis]|uniref:Uncharacterized protein n=1 Tax=Aspergillus felis TaxID=1287682 RepID=A0A8H6PTY2_9EURO|nr:hypothetical protein CNMCM5623_006702 [Aspergillus felis]
MLHNIDTTDDYTMRAKRPPAKSKGTAAAEADFILEKRIQDSQKVAQDLDYDPFIFMPHEWRVAVDFAKFPLKSVPPSVPKFQEGKVPMAPVGIIKDFPYSYNSSHGCFYRLAYTTTFLKAKTCSPWYELCDSTGKTVRSEDCCLLPSYNNDIDRLKLAKSSFEEQIMQLEQAYGEYTFKMVHFRNEQRAWEVVLLSSIHQARLSPIHDDKTMAKIRIWEEQQLSKEDNGEFDTFYYGDAAVPDKRHVYPLQWNRPRGPPLPQFVPQRLKDLRSSIDKVNQAISNLIKPKTRSTAGASHKKRFFFKLSDDEDEDTEQLTLPDNLSIYLDWVAVRHAVWDAAGLPGPDEDLLEKYNLPQHIDGDHTAWPASLKHLGVTKLKIDEDLTAFPWGKPAIALQRTLAKAPGYTKDSLFSDKAMKALIRIEQWYFTCNATDMTALSSKGVDDWAITAKGRTYVIQALEQLGATKETHPTFFA